MFATSQFAGAMFADQAYRDMSVPFVADIPWILQVRDEDGVLLHRLDGWWNAQEQVKVNQPSRLSFTLPLEHPAVASGDIAGPNEIWVLDGSYTIHRRYTIQEERSLLTMRGNTYEVRAEGFLRQLADDRPDTVLSADATVDDVVNSVIAAYNGTPAITKGYINPKIAEAAVDFGDASHQSLLALLNATRQAGIGGWFEIDNERSLNWYDYSTKFPVAVFQLPSNLEGYQEKTRRKDIRNRIYATGGVVGPANNKVELELPSPGYVEDATSITTYGRRVKHIGMPWIRTEAQLLAFANKYLDDHKNPPVRRTLPAIDLSQLQQDPDNSTTRIESVIALGTPVTLKPPSEIPGSPVPFTVNIVGYTRKLDTPLAVTVEFDEEEINIFRMLAKVLNEGGDTNISNVFNQDVEDLWQALDGLSFPDTFTELTDTPGSLIGKGTLYQTNTTPNALTALAIGTKGQRITPNDAGEAIEWVDFFQYTGADKAALGTPPKPAIGLIITVGDNRVMIWDKDAADKGTPDTEDWRDWNSYGKAAT